MAASTMCLINAQQRTERMVWAVLKLTPGDGRRASTAKIIRFCPQPAA